MKKIYFLIAMVLTAFVANAQTPVTIVNGDFSLPADATKYKTINSITGWKSDDLVTDDNGREAAYFAYMKNIGGSIYNVLGEVIPTTSVTYHLTFDGLVSWNPAAGTEVDFVVTFSSLATGAATTTRVPIKAVTIIPGVSTSVYTQCSADVTIPAGAAYAGANLVIEVDCNTPSTTNINTWASVDNFVLTRTVATKVQTVESMSLKTYPSPFNDNLMVESAETIKSIHIYSINGQRIKDLTVNSTRANIGTSDFSKGVYMLKIETENGVKTMTVVK